MEKIIHSEAVCPLASCKRHATCYRYAHYLQAKAEEDTFEIMNTHRISIKDTGCPHYLIKETQRWAKGFKRMFATIPSGNTHHFWTRSPYFSETTYCRAKRGAILIDPAMQRQLLKLFADNGADITLGFDEYVEQEVIVSG